MLLNNLIQILNIPLEEKWPGVQGKEAYTIYRYWNNLDLIDNSTLEAIQLGRRKLTINPIIKTFFKNINFHFPKSIYSNENVADVGSGFGFITFWLILNGANKVHTIGDSSRIGFIEKLYQ